MSLNTSRSAARLSRQALRHCRNHQSPITAPFIPCSSTSASFSTSSARRDFADFTSAAAAAAAANDDLPRWARTPRRMKAPFSPHITKDPRRSEWKVNEDPKKLDDALNKFLGRDGERLLPDELKWLAVTHKSFDQGRRGFNDRLAFLGMFQWFFVYGSCFLWLLLLRVIKKREKKKEKKSRLTLREKKNRTANLCNGSYAVHHHLASELHLRNARSLCRSAAALRGPGSAESR